MLLRCFSIANAARAIPVAGLISTVFLLGIATDTPAAWAANIGVGSGIRIDRPLRSMKDLRDSNVVKQRFDYSCGSAALATLLRYNFDDRLTERDVLVQLFSLLSADEKKVSIEKGFSLLDLQRVAHARGYMAEGFRIEPKDLDKLDGPVIVYIEPHGYKHFAVLRGIRGDRVYLADPSRGNVRMPLYAFLSDWLQEGGTGIIFAVEPDTGLPKQQTPLSLHNSGLPQPEIMSARELLAVGNPYVQLPELSR
jgi:predicted double-glycine peptidase